MSNVQTPIFKLYQDVRHSNIVYYTIPPEAKTETSDVENLLSGKPSTTSCKVTFSEPITIKHWSVRFNSGEFPAVMWRVTADRVSVEFQRFGDQMILMGISGRQFEFLTSPTTLRKQGMGFRDHNLVVDVHLRIVRGMTTMRSLAVDSLLDTRFVVEEKELLANSYLLAAKSEVLKAALFGSMKESISKVIKITDVSLKAVEIFLSFMATDYLEPAADELTLVEVYKLAHRYMVPMIQDETTLQITNLAKSANLDAILQAAHECKAQQVISAILQKILDGNFKGHAESMSHLFV